MKRFAKCILLIFIFVFFTMNTSIADERFEVTMYVGEVIDLDSFLIENQLLSAEEDMSWVSGNDRVIDVNSNGRVEAKEEGKATIYARDKGNSSKIATIKIKVVSMVDSFSLKDEEVSIRIGEVYNLEYDIVPVDGQDNVYEDDIEWTSSYPKVVEVDDYGQIVGVKEGTAKVHAKTVDGGKKDTVIITVSGIQEDILVDNGVEEVKVFVGGEHAFKATSLGKNVTLGVEWSSGLDNILTINDDGVAEGKKSGRTQVKAATKDKKKFDTVMVEVVSMVKDITLNHKSVVLNNIGDTVELEYTLIPAIPGMIPFEDDVEWKSSNSGIAKVSSNGVVTAKDRGVALITATTVDGEIEAHCSITVKENAEDAKIPVGKVYLNEPFEELFIGQKYELPIVLEPKDATEVDLKFRTKLGSSSQIKEEDGVYYFIPAEPGKNEVTIITESEEEYIYKVEVTSPIKNVQIDTSELYKENDKYYFYVGQKILLKPIFELKKDYTQSDIYEKEVTWTVDNKDYLDIDKEKRENETEGDETEYDYYLVGEKRGTTTIKVKSKDGDYEDEIEVKIMSSYEKLEILDQVTLPINTELVPDVNVVMKKDLKYNLIPGVNYDLDQDIEIEHQYVHVESIDEEMEMEKEIIIDLQKSAINSENSAIIYSEINEHKSRLAKLELVRETFKDGYCEIKENVGLEDVFGEAYVVANIDDGIITGKRDGKIELKVSFPGTKITAKGTYYFSSNLKGIIIVNHTGEVISVNESGFSKIFTDAALKEKMELAVRIEERYGNRTNEDTPSSQYIGEILSVEELGFIPNDLRDDYKKAVTRIEMADTFIGLMEYIGDEKIKRPNSVRFNDTSSEVAELAYELGIIDILLPTEFRPYDEITPVTLAKAIERMTIALDAYGYNQDRLRIENDLNSGQKLFIDIDKVSDPHKAYIQKWAIEYSIIEGKVNKLSPDKPLTREEFIYYMYKLVY